MSWRFYRFKAVDTAQCIPRPEQADEKAMAAEAAGGCHSHAAHEAEKRLQNSHVFISALAYRLSDCWRGKTLGAAEKVVYCRYQRPFSHAGPADERIRW